MASYRTQPEDTAGMPKGIPYIIANETAERFSFYGMKAILTIFMTQYLVDGSGALDVMSDADASDWYHRFTFWVYLTPLFGAVLADWVLGKYRTIMLLSLVYCLGHFALAIDETRLGLGVGLGLIALGAGGIKPCVSAHVGDQFGPKNSGLIDKVFGWFYIAINVGAFASSLLTPVLLSEFGPSVAFGVPGVLMALATLAFWRGRKVFAHIPPARDNFIAATMSSGGLRAIAQLLVLYLFVAVFWSLFDQTGSRWVLQARYMDLQVGPLTILPSQVQATNPFFIMLFVPVFAYLVYPTIDRLVTFTPLRKIGVGLFLAVPSFLIPAYVEQRIRDTLPFDPDAAMEIVASGFGLPAFAVSSLGVSPVGFAEAVRASFDLPSIAWHVLAYAIITAAEVLISITCLEFSYTQAPKRMKSLIMGLYFAGSVAVGNLFTSIVNGYIADKGGAGLEGAAYYVFFAKVMFGAALVYALVSNFYRGKTYIQGDET